MDVIWQESVNLFDKRKKIPEFYLLKPDLLRLLTNIKNCDFDHRAFQILNTLAIENKSWITNDLDILNLFISILVDLLSASKHKKLPELGEKWVLRVLRWLLVVEVEISEISELKKCFLIAFPRQEFYLQQMRISLTQLSAKISTFIQVSDINLLKYSLDGFAEYFRVDPILLLEEEILIETDKILSDLISKNLFHHLTDDFISNLLIESSSQYYHSLKDAHKKELCKYFIDVFEFQILQLNQEIWFISWLSKDLGELQKLANFMAFGRPDLKIFLEQNVKDKIFQYGRLRCYHSASTYSEIFESISQKQN